MRRAALAIALGVSGLLVSACWVETVSHVAGGGTEAVAQVIEPAPLAAATPVTRNTMLDYPNARTDQNIVPEPATAPTPPARGGIYTDPDFGARILRVTDGSLNGQGSFWPTGGTTKPNWNADATKFYCVGDVDPTHGPNSVFMFDFDKTNFTAAIKAPPGGGWPGANLGWSWHEPDLMYAAQIQAGHIHLRTYNVTAKAWAEDLLDLHALAPDFTAGAGAHQEAWGSVASYAGYADGAGQVKDRYLSTGFGGTQQDTDPYAVWYDRSSGRWAILDIIKRRMRSSNGQNYDFSAMVSAGHVGSHGVSIDKSGRFVTISAHGGTNADMVWDLGVDAQGNIGANPAAMTVAYMQNPSRYESASGFGCHIQQVVNSSWMNAYRDYANPTVVRSLMDLSMYPKKGANCSAHITWNNATDESAAARFAPFFPCNCRYPNSPWDVGLNEVIAVRSDTWADPASVRKRYRFCHTFLRFDGNYYKEGFGNVSQDGRWYTFQSTWGDSLGNAAGGKSGGNNGKRFDLFVVDLASANKNNITGLPHPWTQAEIGASATEGVGNYNNLTGTYTLQSKGGDIGGASDDFHYTFVSATTGDFEAVVHVSANGVVADDNAAKAGIMVRDGTAANAPFAMAYVTKGNGAGFGYRLTSGAAVHSDAGAPHGAPTWLKIARNGNRFSGYCAPASTGPWTLIGAASQDIAMTRPKTGLAVSSNSTSRNVAATLQSLSIRPVAWSRADINCAGQPGNEYLSDRQWYIRGGGADIGGTSDAFRYVYQATDGDSTINANVDSVEGADESSKAGIMIRESTDPGAKYVAVFRTPNHGIRVQYRDATGQAAVCLQGPDIGYVYHRQANGKDYPYRIDETWSIKVVRAGNVFKVYSSPFIDGWLSEWVQIGGDIAVSMNSVATAGMAVTSHNTRSLAEGVLKNIGFTP